MQRHDGPHELQRVILLAVLVGGSLLLPSQAAVIDVNHYRFDPTISEPTIPADLRAPRIDGSALYLVQFSGSIEESWKTALTDRGAVLYSYIPDYTFVVRMDAGTAAAASALPQVRWVGPYHVAYRISPEIGRVAFREEARAQDPLRTLLVLVADDLDATVESARSLGTIQERFDDAGGTGFVIHIDPARIVALATLPAVLWVEETPETFVVNNNTRWVVQSNVNPEVPIWDHGILGAGQILAMMDTGLDYNSCWFRDTGDALPGPSNRKVIDYTSWGGNEYDGCGIGHGTHVAGTALGDQSFVNPGNLGYNGAAYLAKIAVQDVGSDSPSACSGGFLSVPVNLTGALTAAYDLGARVHTDSWSSSSSSYGFHSVNVDNFMWSHPDFLFCAANGNEGPGSGTVGTPATSKNCISVGATNQAPGQDYITGYSSRGPTLDGRRKPTLAAPGGGSFSIYSANNDPGNPPLESCGVVGLTGTSMATPAVAGCALLVRDYFAQGFYPFGAVGGDPLNASAALVKAMLINSGVDMVQGGTDQPNNIEGWGRILLNDAMYFTGDTRELHVESDDVGLATGEQASFSYEVDSSVEPLEVSLVWTDYPGATNANPALVNDLNLVVTSPTSANYLGNAYTAGQSATGGTADNRNVEECVRRNSPEVGTWMITVTGLNVAQGGHQPFAVVTTGSFGSWPAPSSAVRDPLAIGSIRLDPARPNPTSGSTTLAFEMASPGKARLAVYDASGRQVALLADGTVGAGLHRYDWNGREANGAPAASGIYFYRLDSGPTTITRKLTRMR